jgi:site-specific DNA-cytosine methylase
MQWNWTVSEPGHFQCIWASPPCTHYSIARTTAKTPRDIEGSNRLVERVLECIDYFKPTTWFFENPQSGYLKDQPVVQGLKYRDTSYCFFIPL